MKKNLIKQKLTSFQVLIPKKMFEDLIIKLLGVEVTRDREVKLVTLEEYSKYNNFHVLFKKYLSVTGMKGLRILKNSSELLDFKYFQFLKDLPRLNSLQCALLKLNIPLDPDVKLFTQRGDLVNFVMASFPIEANGFNKINHIAIKKYGKIFLYHDSLRKDPDSSKMRNLQYSGYKFEKICTFHDWPEDFTKWKPLDPVSNTFTSISTILKININKDMGIIIRAENDSIEKDMQVYTLDSLIEFKCYFRKKPPYFAHRDWSSLDKYELLNVICNEWTFYKFFRICLQSLFAGSEKIVIGIHDGNSLLVSVEMYSRQDIENYLKKMQASKKIYYDYYLNALDYLKQLIILLDDKCSDGGIYKITKPNWNVKLRIDNIESSEVVFKNMFIDNFDEFLLKQGSDTITDDLANGISKVNISKDEIC